MDHASEFPPSRLIRGFFRRLRRPELLACLPALTLGAYLLGGERLLYAASLGLPFLIGLAALLSSRPETAEDMRDGVTGLLLRDALLEALDDALDRARSGGRGTACIVVTLDEPDSLIDRFGHACFRQILRHCAERLGERLREGDTIARLPGASFAIALMPSRRQDLETTLQLAARLQHALSLPIPAGKRSLVASVSVGFCLGERAPAPGGAALLAAAELAAENARRQGPGAIRAHAPEMSVPAPDALLDDRISLALENGEIRAHFQPQISTDTGEISGFEVLARWQHPSRGLIAPGDFLPALLEAGLSERLSEVMLVQALAALRSWDNAGLHIPTVAINLSGDELRNPRLPSKLKWELDRFDLAPSRLTVEILETVAADAQDDVIERNIAALAAMGCGVDLDDFGTGQSAISIMHRYAIRRIKIDRSFVTRADEDRDKQRMLSAILALAEQLGLETLAEGVETPGEHAMLAQLGCGHVQGFGIARPMPLAETAVWIERHRAKLDHTPLLGKHLR
ncbi:putative bifunctional diguanylate cyclase/phosphodiesterase [Plastorhodobacter daqingensis]|uniref:Bifunctional diguanylate cyclase/phosphodiesterase n=1 Tax=Plastorhodobacter daqingensis TaxID=1387281 RepID=A0ABW2UH02_9RHOB